MTDLIRLRVHNICGDCPQLERIVGLRSGDGVCTAHGVAMGLTDSACARYELERREAFDALPESLRMRLV